MDRTGTKALASIGVVLALLACDEKDDGVSQQAGVEASYQQLSGAFATCDQRLEECAAAAEGDQAALNDCGLAYRGCRDEAGEQVLKPLAKAIQACAEKARECKQNAEGYAEKASCRSQLWSCLGDHRPGSLDDAGESDTDAGTDESGHHGWLVRECIEKLKASVEAGEDAHTCARNIRLCIAQSLPRPDDRSSGSSEAAPSGSAAKRSAATRACIGEFRGCVRKKQGPRECVEALRQCTHPSTSVEP